MLLRFSSSVALSPSLDWTMAKAAMTSGLQGPRVQRSSDCLHPKCACSEHTATLDYYWIRLTV